MLWLDVKSPPKPVKIFKVTADNPEIKLSAAPVKEQLSSNMQEIEKIFREIYQESGIKDDITAITFS